MDSRLRVGLVGADAAGRGWGASTHLPALRSVERIEVTALCTSRPGSAAAAQEAHGIRAFHDVAEMAAQPDVDLVAVVVRVPHHRDAVVPVLEAGKPVFCEWPLGADLGEAREMAALARSAGVVTAVGLQGRQDPTLAHLRELVRDGFVGDVVSANLTMFGGGAGRSSSATAWMGDAANGANLLTIVVGHSLDALSHCLGPLVEVTASVATRVPRWHLEDTDDIVAVDAPDDVALTGRLSNGATVVLHAASVPHHGDGWRLRVHGTGGTVVATTRGLPQIAPVTLRGARGGDELRPLEVPARDDPPGLPTGPAANVARAYASVAAAVLDGDDVAAGFDHAEQLHELLDALERSSAEGRTVRLGRRAPDERQAGREPR